ncbi:MAG: universal stress protein [Myxococcota bacterium]|jgi:nucleotide-binding universal stress UspA family protein|nr:universal stress protein [Myxococcota bacterium]
MIESILVASDGSECATAAERCAVALAVKLGASLNCLTVIEDQRVRAPASEGLSLPPFPEAELAAYHRARADAILRRVSERARAAGLEANCEVAQGCADDRIAERSLAASLTVIGRDSRSESNRGGLFGSTAEAVSRKTTRPVLVVPPGGQIAGSLVLGFDGSPGSKIAARLTVFLSDRLGEPVHVFVDSKDKGRAITRFEDVRKLLSGVTAPIRETSSTLGRPDVKIVDAARDAHAGMIVMGAYGRNRITDFFIGSNAAAVVRTSPVPVLLAR